MKNFRFSNWIRGETLFPKKFFYELSVENDMSRGSKRMNIVCFYVLDKPECGETWQFGKHYIGINTYFCWSINFSIYR